MPLSIQDMADQGLINELATLYRDATSATMLLLASGYSEALMPPWTSARPFWLAACQAIAGGATPGAFEPVLARAARTHPHSDHFRPYAQHRVAAAQQPQGAPSPPAEAPQLYLLVQGAHDTGALLSQVRDLAGQYGHEPDSVQPAFANPEGAFLEMAGWQFEQVVALGNTLRERHQEYIVSVSRTDFADYMLHQLFVEGPDQQRYEINSIRASTPIRDVVQGVTSSFYKGTASAMQSGRTVAVDLQSKDGKPRRVKPNNTLHEEKVQDGDTLEMHPESRAGGVHPETREAALVGANREVMAFAEAHPGFEVLSNSHHASTEYQFEFTMPSFAPPSVPGAAPRPFAEHQVYLALMANFPMQAPQAFWQTEIFHPNIHRATGKVCLGILDDCYVPGLDFGRLCQLLMDIAGYRNYAINEAYDKEALLWARSAAGQKAITDQGGLPLVRMMLEDALELGEPRRPLRIRPLNPPLQDREAH